MRGRCWSAASACRAWAMRVACCADAARPRAQQQSGVSRMLALRESVRSCTRARVARCALLARPQRTVVASQDATYASRGAGAAPRAAPGAATAETAQDTPSAPGGQYPFKEVEERWQRYWEANATFRTPTKVDTSKPKFYALDMFPYPRRGSCALNTGRPADAPWPVVLQWRGPARGPPGRLHRH